MIGYLLGCTLRYAKRLCVSAQDCRRRHKRVYWNLANATVAARIRALVCGSDARQYVSWLTVCFALGGEVTGPL